METHSKTVILLVGFFITITGWWLWQFFLAGMYSANPSPYAVKHAFWTTFGADLNWWVTLLGVLIVLTVIQLVFKTAKRSLVRLGLWKGRWSWLWSCGRWRLQHRQGRTGFDKDLENWDLQLWQEMEQDPEIREKLKQLLEEEEEGLGLESDESEVNEKEEAEEGTGILKGLVAWRMGSS